MQDAIGHALAELSERGFNTGHNWHGELMPHLKDLTVEQALWRPAEDRKCIWEGVRHLVFWRRALLNRLKGLAIPEKGDNGWSLPEPADDATWRADLAGLKAIQDELEAWLKDRQPDALLQKDEDGRYEQFAFEAGIIAHDSYHTGQIAYIRALMGLPPVE